MQLTSSDGVSLRVHDLPTSPVPGAPTVLLTHATGFHGLVWRPLAVRLPAGRAFAPDLRGHGASTAPEGRDFAWRGFADDVLAVVDGLGLVGAVGVGHSKGGAALLLAEQRRPGTFAALYLYEPVVFPRPQGPPTETSLAAGARRRRDRFESRRDAYDNFAGKSPFDVLHPEALWAYVEHGFVDEAAGGVRLACRPDDESEVYRMGGAHDAFSHLDQVRCPVTVARGAVSGFGPAAFAEQIADALPNGTLSSHSDLGHFGPLQDPARIAQEVTRSLTG